MRKMRLLVLGALVFSGANAQNLNLDTWSNSTTATGWSAPLNGFEVAIPGEDASVNEATGVSGSCARLNPIDLTALDPSAPIISIFGLGTDTDGDLVPDGIPYTTRIESIDFQAKLSITGDAVAVVQALMISGTDTIGGGAAEFMTDISNFTAQNLVIEYDPAFDGVDPDRLVLVVAIFATSTPSTDTDFFVDQFVLNDVDNTSLNELDGDIWKVATSNNQIVVSGVDAGEVVVYNTNGQILGSASVVNGIASVDASNASGMVVVQLTRGNESGIKKVILFK